MVFDYERVRRDPCTRVVAVGLYGGGCPGEMPRVCLSSAYGARVSVGGYNGLGGMVKVRLHHGHTRTIILIYVW